MKAGFILWKSYQTGSCAVAKPSIKTPDIPEFHSPLCALPNTRSRCEEGHYVSYLSFSVNVLGPGVHASPGTCTILFSAHSALAQASLSRDIWTHPFWRKRP